MDALTNLLAILSVLSGLYLTLALICMLIERLPAYAVARPRRGRVQRTQRRMRTPRPRRRRGTADDLAALPEGIAR
jgi:hypothetical protein